MRTIPRAVLVLAGALTLAAPITLAANSVGPTDIVLADRDGRALQYIPRDEIIKIQITVKNNDANRFNDALALDLRITDEDGDVVYNDTARSTVNIPAGQSTVVEHEWPPAGRGPGNHTLRVTVQDSTHQPFAATFVVTETAVEAGTYVEKVARYSWFLGTFIIAVVLFAVVLAARRA